VNDWPLILKTYASTDGDFRAAAQLLKAGCHPEPLVSLMRSGIVAGSTSAGLDSLTPYQGANAALIESLQSSSSFFGMLGSMIPCPFRTYIFSVTAAALGSAGVEGQVRPLTSLGFDNNVLDFRVALAIIGLTAELVRSAAPAALGLINSPLTKSDLVDSV
jgi:hypothetical protein